MSLVMAHRGASATHPENTLAAYEAARHAGADGVELDVRASADGVLVCHHDPILGDSRLVAGTRVADLPDTVPTLTEALDVLVGLLVNVEIKHLPTEPDHDPSGSVATAVTELLAARDHSDSVLVSSFDIDALDHVARRSPGLARGWLVLDGVVEALIDKVVERGHQAIHPWDPLVDRHLVERAHHAGLRVFTWTVDDPSRIAALADLQVDGIITNDPGAARRALGR